MTTLEATGGQSSLDYELLDRSSQEAIFEIYQHLQDGGDFNLLQKYEGMVANIIRDVNNFSKEKSDLESTLRSEKSKYNAYLEHLENDVETQIQNVEQNVKKELNDKHQRELDALRKQMEAKMTELHDNVMKFNEESAKISAAAANTTEVAKRRGSVAPTEIISMRNQVTELADQSSSLRSELAMAQTALSEYRQQVQGLVNLQRLPDQQLHFMSSPTKPEQRLQAQINEDRYFQSRRSSRLSNFANNSDSDPSYRNSQNTHSIVSPEGDDSGVGGGYSRDGGSNQANVTPIPENYSAQHFSRRNKRSNSGPAEPADLGTVLAETGYTTNTGEITPPEFTDPNNLPEHVQFKLERFQQSMMDADFDESQSSGSNRYFGHRRKERSILSQQKSIASSSGGQYRKGSTATTGTLRSGGNRYVAGRVVEDMAAIPRSRGTVALRTGTNRHALHRGHSSSMNSLQNLYASNENLAMATTASQGGRGSSLGRNASVFSADDNTTVFETSADALPNKIRPQMAIQSIVTPATVAVEPERVYRVVLAGDSAVGKSSILMRIVEDKFVGNLPTTLGVDFFTRLFQIDEDDTRTVALQLWDTAGQERFRSLARSYFRRADGVLLVYDVTSEKTFLSVRDWISIVRDSSDADVSVLICANKADLRQFCSSRSMSTVSTNDGHQLAEAYNTYFVETSAKTGDGIMEAITQLIRSMRNKEDVTIRTAGLHLDEHVNKKTHTLRCAPIGASASVKRPTCN